MLAARSLRLERATLLMGALIGWAAPVTQAQFTINYVIEQGSLEAAFPDANRRQQVVSRIGEVKAFFERVLAESTTTIGVPLKRDEPAGSVVLPARERKPSVWRLTDAGCRNPQLLGRRIIQPIQQVHDRVLCGHRGREGRAGARWRADGGRHHRLHQRVYRGQPVRG